MFRVAPFNRYSVQKPSSDFVDFYNMIDDFFNDSLVPRKAFRNETFKLDVKETNSDYQIDAELPGFKKEEIAIDFQEGNLVIKAEKVDEINDENERFVHKERRVCAMQRSVYLKNVKYDAITAKLVDGILTINIPKQELLENKARIEIE